MKIDEKSLCQDCLCLDYRVEDGLGKCECGGNTCHCPWCVETMDLLLQGERDFEKLGLLSSISVYILYGTEKTKRSIENLLFAYR